MKAYLAIKYHQDYRNKEVVDSITSVLENKGYETSCIVRDIENMGIKTSNPQQLMKLAFREIDNCDLVVVELTEKGVGIGIEAGYAFAKGIPIISIAQRGSDVSETLVGISNSVICYNTLEDIGVVLNKLLQHLVN